MLSLSPINLVFAGAASLLSALSFAAPASAQIDPMLAGAAFAKSDLRPLTGVTVLRFIPGVGLQRYPLNQPPTESDGADSAPVSTPEPAAAPVQETRLKADGETLADKPIQVWARQALGEMINLTAPRASRYYVFVATGDRQLGYNFGHSAVTGWSPEGLTFERSRSRSQVRVGLAWQDGPYSATFGVAQLKARVFAPWRPGLTDDRVELTFVHEDR